MGPQQPPRIEIARSASNESEPDRVARSMRPTPSIRPPHDRRASAPRMRAVEDEGRIQEAPRRWSLALFRAAWDRMGQDDGEGLAAGLAFGALLSIAPLLLVVLAIASLLLGRTGAEHQLDELVTDSFGASAASVVDQWVVDARTWSRGATIVGVILFLVGGARLVGLVDGAFRMVFDMAPPEAPEPGVLGAVRSYSKHQLKTIAVTLAAGVLMVGSLVLRALGESIIGAAPGELSGVIWVVGRELVSLAVWTAALALVYRALPPLRLHRADVLEGAIVSAVLVEGALIVLRVGASQLDFGAAYGAASAVIGVLVMLYVTSTLFLFGAELTAELAARRGMGVRSSRHGRPRRERPAPSGGTP